jgi:delta-aminolevulinic acid dehydratase/porphobilinogen synthase
MSEMYKSVLATHVPYVIVCVISFCRYKSQKHCGKARPQEIVVEIDGDVRGYERTAVIV